MPVVLNFGNRLGRFAYREPSQDLRINILEGSVRAGKTWAMIPKMMYACRHPVSGWKVITGASKDTVYKNVLNDLFDFVGPHRYHYNHQSGHLRLCGSNWMVMGASDIGAEKFLRGMTIGMAFCDELTQMPKSFFQMLNTRMSPVGARLYATTNTDSPLHWLKKEYLDRATIPQAAEGLKGLLWSMRCTMDDNPNLSEEFKRSQKALYRGLFYQRFILGLWVLAEGGIYRDAWSDELKFNDKTAPLGLKNPGGHVDRWIAADCGVDHPQVYLEFYDDGTTVWITREWFWDSKLRMRQLTDAQYADKLIEFMGPQTACQVIIPPEALSFKTECRSRGMWVTDANNEVNEGINTVSSMMIKKKVRIHESCEHLLQEITTYAWDPKASVRGKEQPIKSGDDAVDAGRYGLHGKIPRWRIAA